MLKSIKKNQKKVLAVFGVLLMVAFTLPTFFGQTNSRREYTYGFIGNTDLSSTRVQQAQKEWDFLLRNVFVDVRGPEDFDPNDPMKQRSNRIPIAAYELNSGQNDGNRLMDQIKANPEMYALLQEEAHRMGVTVTPEMAQIRFTNTEHSPEADAEPEYTIAALRNLLLVKQAFERVAGTAHISRPRRDHMLADLQQVALNLVEFNAKDYLSKVPTTLEAKEIQEQFDKYKNTIAGSSEINHWGFGYKIPDQVRIQYLAVEDSKVRAAVETDLDPIDLKKYYKQHLTKYPTSAPASKPAATEETAATAPTTMAATTTSATTLATSAPATRPASSAPFASSAPATTLATSQPAPLTYDHYRDQVRTDVISERASELRDKIIADITATMAADYVAFTKSAGTNLGEHPTTLPATLPTAATSSIGPAYVSKDYLDKLALRMQEKYKVLPTVQTIGSLMNAKELGELPGIGKSRVFLEVVFQRVPFGDFATRFADALMTDADRTAARQRRMPLLALYQPSQALDDDASNQYIFRLTEILAAHSPASLADVKSAIEADLRQKKAYELALQDAKAFLAKARLQRLAGAAYSEDRTIIPTSLFNRADEDPQQRMPMQFHLPAEYFISDRVAAADFLAGAYKLMREPGSADSKHPVGLIELNEPDTAKVVVAEIAATKPSWKSEMTATYQMVAQVEQLQRDRLRLRSQWFQFDELAKRLNYRPATARKATATNTDDE